MRQILVVDDDELMIEFISDAVKLVGVSATAVANGRDLRAINLEHYEHILLDLSIPGADGVQLLRWLKDKEYKGSISITSGCEASVLNSAQQLGLNYGLKMHLPLAKPFPLERLLNVIQDDTAKARKSPSLPHANLDETLLIPALKNAIKNKEIKAFFQPKFDIDQLYVLGVEALARWRLADGTMVPPPIFIDLAEKHNLIGELTDCIIHQVLPLLQQWLKVNINLQVSINLSAASLNNLNLPDYLSRLTKKYNIPNKNIVVELTESALAEDTSASVEILTRLRMKGFGLSIDDFGTGYSSIKQLQDVPFNELKIDRSFISNYATRPQSKTIVESTIEMAHKLNIHVVAEGIEDAETLDYLKKIKCDQGQGFFYAKPMPGSEFSQWLHNHPEYLDISVPFHEQKQIVVVSGDKLFSDTLIDVLNVEFDVVILSDESTFISDLTNYTADIILVDNSCLNDGFDVCRQINDRLLAINSTVLFVGKQNTNEKLKAFSAGCDDYFVKLDSIGQLQTKLRTIKQQQVNKKHHLFYSEADETLVNTTELGCYRELSLFLSQLILSQDQNSFISTFYDFTNRFNWHVCVQLETREGIRHYRAANAACSAMEENTFSLLKDAGEIYYFNNRLIINVKYTSLLFNYCPVVNEPWFEAFSLCLAKGLEKKWRELSHVNAMSEMINGLELTLSSLKKRVSIFEQDAHKIIDALLLDIRANLLITAVDKSVEHKLINLIETSVSKVLALGEDGREIEIEFSHIITQYKQHHLNNK